MSSERERAVTEALAAADVYAEHNQHGADAGHLRALADEVRRAERAKARAAKEKKEAEEAAAKAEAKAERAKKASTIKK